MKHTPSHSGVMTALSLLLKTLAAVSAIWGTCLSAAANTNEFMGGNTVFMYFTIQSNLALAAVCIIGGLLLLRGKAIPLFWQVVKLVATVAISVTGLVFCFVLAPTLGENTWALSNVLTHVVVPVACVIDFFLVAPGFSLKNRYIPWAVLPPVAYAIYAGIGYVNNWQFSHGYNYPYFFLNWGSPAGAFGFCNELPFMGCVWWILLLLIMILLLAWCYAAIARRLGTNREQY